jgi:hypothetical protein
MNNNVYVNSTYSRRQDPRIIGYEDWRTLNPNEREIIRQDGLRNRPGTISFAAFPRNERFLAPYASPQEPTPRRVYPITATELPEPLYPELEIDATPSITQRFFNRFRRASVRPMIPTVDAMVEPTLVGINDNRNRGVLSSEYERTMRFRPSIRARYMNMIHRRGYPDLAQEISNMMQLDNENEAANGLRQIYNANIATLGPIRQSVLEREGVTDTGNPMFNAIFQTNS